MSPSMSTHFAERPFPGGSLVLLLVALIFLVPTPTGVATSHGFTPTQIPLAPSPELRWAHASMLGNVSAARPAPAASLDMSWDGITPSAISLTWVGTNDLFFSSYTVEFSTVNASGPWRTVTTITSQTTTSIAVTGLSPGGTYWWRVSETGLSTSTGTVLQTTQPVLSVLTFTTPTTTSAVFNWTNNATYGGFLSFVSYSLLESANAGVPVAVRTISVASTRTATVTGLSPGTSYLFFLNTSDCFSGCGGASQLTTVTQSNSVTFGTPRALTASLLATRPVLDAGQLDYFICSPSGGTSPFRFAWNYGNGTFVPGASSVSYGFAAPGTPSVVCRITDNASVSATASINILVDSTPILTASANRTSLDVGQTVTFNASFSGGTLPYSVSWNFGDGTGSTLANVAHAYSRSVPTNAICTFQDSAGVQLVHAFFLTIDPAVTLGGTASAYAAAPGTNLRFVATAANGTGIYGIYAWSFGDGATAKGSITNHTFQATGTYPVTVAVSDSNGGRAASSLTVHVTTISVLLVVSSTSVVAGSTVNFSASASGGAGGPYTYSWSFGDGAVMTGASVTHRFGTAGTFHVVLVVTDALGAAAPQSPTTLTVSKAPGPYAWLSAPVLLGIAGVAGLLLGLFAYGRRRRRERETIPTVGWVPGTDLRQTVRGVKICDFCGRSNLPLRRTCEGCGHALSRRLSR